MTTLWLDLETYNGTTPISAGTHRYAEDAEILLMAYAIDDGPVQVVDMTAGAKAPRELQAALADPKVKIWAHNSHFDRTILKRALPELVGDPSRWRDTMVQALAHGLPGSLSELCDILRIPQDKAKDKEARGLMLTFSKPDFKGRRFTSLTNPHEWAKFLNYARLDVEAMRAVHKALPRWNYAGAELELWHLDQRINDRGVQIDVHLVEACVEAVGAAQAGLALRTAEITNGSVQAATQRDALLAYALQEYGVGLPDLTASTIERRLQDPGLDEGLRELLRIRQQAATSSTAKYTALALSVSADGRLRGTLQFCGASRTGRWSGRLFQPQNLPRPSLPQGEIVMGIQALLAGGAELIFDDIMELASSALRGAIIAPHGRKLVVADLSNIEGRVAAWLAGEWWKLEAFEDFDEGIGPDLYKLAYAKSFGIDPADVDKAQRQVGKVQELALQYEGGAGAFVTFAAAYGVRLDDLAELVAVSAPVNVVEDARGLYDWMQGEKRNTYGLARETFAACDTLKRLWRQAHPAIVQCWASLMEAAVKAVDQAGARHQAGRVAFLRDGNWLRCILPSGRSICYPSPRMIDGKLTYMGIDQYTKKWQRIDTYGGKLFENICQAVARDVLASAMQSVEEAGYAIVLSVHDELITETPDAEKYSDDHLAALMSFTPVWAPGLPLAAAGFQTYRYRKE